MGNYVLEQHFAAQAEMTPKVLAVANMFGIGADRNQKVTVLDKTEIRVEAGQVVYITGGSGAGKSVVLKLLAERMENPVWTDQQQWAEDRVVVDCFEGPIEKTLAWLSAAGMSEAFVILRRPEELSAGQRYRLRLALALASGAKVICIDEFCNTLDRVTAAVVAHNVRRFADRFGVTFLLATSHDDLLDDLQPDVVVIKHLGSYCETYYPKRRRGEYPKDTLGALADISA